MSDSKWIKVSAFPLAALLGAALLYFFPPEQHGFYPRCLLHELTGIQCPGCGGLRAVHHILHGHLLTAFHYNPLLITLLPLLMVLYGAWTWKVLTGKPSPIQMRNPVWIWLLVGLVIVFGVGRNLPLGSLAAFRL